MEIQNGDRLPTLTAPVVDGGSLTLPDDAGGRAVLLVYRGHW